MIFMYDLILRKTAKLLVIYTFCDYPSSFDWTGHFCQDAFQPEDEDHELLNSLL